MDDIIGSVYTYITVAITIVILVFALALMHGGEANQTVPQGTITNTLNFNFLNQNPGGTAASPCYNGSPFYATTEISENIGPVFKSKFACALIDVNGQLEITDLLPAPGDGTVWNDNAIPSYRVECNNNVHTGQPWKVVRPSATYTVAQPSGSTPWSPSSVTATQIQFITELSQLPGEHSICGAWAEVYGDLDVQTRSSLDLMFVVFIIIAAAVVLFAVRYLY